MKNKPKYVELDRQRLPFTLCTLSLLLGPETSYEQAKAVRNAGVITQRQRQWYVTLWVWSALRDSDIKQGALKQDKGFAACGVAGLMRRIARVQALREKLWGHWLSPYFLIQKSS